MKMPKYTETVLIAAAIAGLLPGVTVAQTAKLKPEPSRITDQVISADQKTYAAVQARIKALNDMGIRVADYYLAKAQCWLDVSFHEYTRNDRSAFPQEALTQSAAIVSALERNVTPNPGEQTPLVNNATKLRDDLWAKFDNLKKIDSTRFRCAAQKVACGEVELVHAGNEYRQQGWRHANPYIQIAEDLYAAADMATVECIPPAPPAPVIAPPPVVTTEKIELGADALFVFDKWQRQDILPAGAERLVKLARAIREGFVRVDSMKVTGYTDRLGSDAYNLRLSERRAATVKQFLREEGLDVEIETLGRGKEIQVAACGTSTVRTKELIACLQPNRRVEVEIRGIKRTDGQ